MLFCQNDDEIRGDLMPTLSVFYGIIVQMYNETKGKHKMPHLHAEYGEHEIEVSFDGEILAGSLPANKLKLLLAWIELRREDIEANWQLLKNGEDHFKIKPLD
jgi:hypothetical protein